MAGIRWTVMTEVQTKPVQWLWDGRIPSGKLTLLDGEPGSSKSLLALDLAAKVSHGAAMPLSRQKPNAPATVVLYNDDDNLADTIRPRLEAAGADLSRIHWVDSEIGPDDVRDLRPALIIIDPLSVYLTLGSETSPPRLLKNLTTLARESGAAVLAVQHLPKNAPWAGEVFDAARSVLLVSNIGHGRHRVAVSKSNLRSIAEVPPLVYHLDGRDTAVHIADWADSV